jgi:hypothetical protein
MKANVQYNDFLGTAAADIADGFDLDQFLLDRGIDVVRYKAIGANFYHGYSDFFSASIICLDQEKSTEQNPYIVAISFEAEFTHENFFNLFKRFNVVINKKYNGYGDFDLKEEIVFDDRVSQDN